MVNDEFGSGLNPEQQRAVEQTEGPLLIQAGAGSGKTSTLTHRIAYLIRTGRTTPYNILAVTFTNKAAREMRERVATLLGAQADDRGFMPYIGTFHSICVRLLRMDGEHIGVPRDYIIYDETDRLSLIKRILKARQVDEKEFTPRTIAGLISSAKNDMISPEDYAMSARSPAQHIAADVYPLYQQALKEAMALDFDDLIARTVELMSSVPSVREKWRSHFHYVMIDEYQDTNTAQYTLVRHLTGDHQNLAVVGDDWQSIYSWRGADFRNILRFTQDFPDSTVISLEQNYRSTGNILGAAQSVILRNEQRSDKKLWTESGEGQKVQIRQVMTERAEAEAVVNLIQDGRLNGRGYGDFAVLYRTNAQSRVVEEQFMRRGIPYRIVGGQRFYDRAEIKDVLAYLRLIYQPNDRASFERVVNLPGRGIGAKSLQSFFLWMERSGYSLEEAMANIDACDVKGKAKNGLLEFTRIIKDFRARMDSELPDVMIEKLIKRIGYMDYLNDGTHKGEARQENVQELVGVAQAYQAVGLSGFLEELALVSDLDDVKIGDEAVTLMTVHSAKGLEFPIVSIIGMEEAIFPHSRSLYSQNEMEEERRLCYVAMTRAREELYIFYAVTRSLYGGVQHNIPSRFIGEMSGVYVEEQTQMPSFGSYGLPSSQPGEDEDILPIQQADKDDSEPRYVPEFYEGEQVKHATFGTGVIMQIEGEVAAINFGTKGVKKMHIAFAPLEKVE